MRGVFTLLTLGVVACDLCGLGHYLQTRENNICVDGSDQVELVFGLKESVTFQVRESVLVLLMISPRCTAV